MSDFNYTIRRGDTLGLIAARFGVTMRALTDANPGLRADPNRIIAGQVIRVPDAGTAGGGARSNDSILYVGMNPRSTYEAQALRATGARVTAVHDAPEPDRVKGPGGQVFDLSTDEGASAFAATFGLPPEQTASIARAIVGAPEDARDELGRIAEVWAAAERGGDAPSRLVLSGHSVGRGVWGDDNGTLTLDALARLAEVMPEAARRVEDLHIAGCYSGGAYAMARLRGIFPRIKTIWAYAGQAPIAGPAAARHGQLWERATRGTRADLDRAIAARTAAGENVAVWTVTRGYQDGNPPQPIDEVRRDLALLAPTFDAHFRGDEAMASPQRGPLRDYYDALQACLQHPDLPPAERPALEARRDVTIRLIYYAATVARRFAAQHAGAIRAGFAAVGLPAPDFGALSRGEALERIATFTARARTSADPEVSALLTLLQRGLVELDPAVIPDAWV